MLNFNHAWYFDRVAAEGSIARAAQSLAVSQSTISEQLREFERALGLTLFERGASGLRLTEAGRRVREHTQEMFRVAERLVELVVSDARGPRVFSVGIAASVSRSVAAGLLMPLITLDACRPNVCSGELEDLVRSLRGGVLDLVLTESDMPPAALRGLRAVELFRTRLVAVASPQRAASPAAFDWQRTPVVHFRPGSSYRWEVDDWLKTRGASPPVAAETDDCALMLEAAARGAGLAFVPTSIARDAIRLGRVRALATLDESATTVRALVHDRDGVDLAERAIDVIRAHARESLAEGDATS